MRKSTVLILHIIIVISKASLEVGVIFQTDVWGNTDTSTKYATGLVEYSQYHVQGLDDQLFVHLMSNLSESGVIGIIAFTSCPVATVLATQSKAINLPLINIVNGICPESLYNDQSFFISNCFLQNSIVINLVQHMRWQRVNIVYDSTQSLCIQRLVTLLSVNKVSSNAALLSTGDGFIPEMFPNLWLEQVFYITADEETTLRIVSEAMDLDMFNRSYFWVLNLAQEKVMNSSMYKPLHDGFVLLIPPDSEYNEMMTDTLLEDALSIYTRGLNSIKEANSSNTGILSLRNTLQQYIPTECYNSSAWRGRQSPVSVLSSVKNSRAKFEDVAVYSQKDRKLHFIEDRLFQNDFADFGNRTLKVVSVVGEPFQMRVDEGNGSFHFYGFTYDLLDEFARKFNFRYEILDSVDGLYGNPTDDGQNASGMVGMVMRGEADIAVGGFTITPERLKVVDFIYPFQEDGIGIIMKKVDNTADRMFRVFSPFEIGSWIATISAVFVAAMVLSLVVKFSPFSRGLNSNVSTSFWLAFSAFLQQGEDKDPNSLPGRVVLGIWWIFTIIIMSLYTANLAAFLTVSMARAPIKNLEELASQTVYKPLVKDGTNLYMLFQNAKGGVYKKIWDMMADMPKIISPEEGYDMIIKGQYAYMTDESETKFKEMKDCKRLEMADETFHKAELSFVIQKNAEFKEAFNKHMLKMVQSGIVDKYKKKWWRSRGCHSTNTATELSFQSTSGIFIVYSGFILISVLCCIAELLLHRRKNEKNKVNSSKENLDVDADSIVMVDL